MKVLQLKCPALQGLCHINRGDIIKLQIAHAFPEKEVAKTDAEKYRKSGLQKLSLLPNARIFLGLQYSLKNKKVFAAGFNFLNYQYCFAMITGCNCNNETMNSVVVRLTVISED